MNGRHELWRELYEAAASEPDCRLRILWIMEAQDAILEHALLLEVSHGTDEECCDLERAAEGLRRMKIACHMN